MCLVSKISTFASALALFHALSLASFGGDLDRTVLFATLNHLHSELAIPPGLIPTTVLPPPELACSNVMEIARPLPEPWMELVDTRLERTMSPDDFLRDFARHLAKFDHRYSSSQMEQYWQVSKGRERPKVLWHFFQLLSRMAGGIFYTVSPDRLTVWHYSFDPKVVGLVMGMPMTETQETVLSAEMLLREYLFLVSGLDARKQKKYKFVWHVPFFEDVQKEVLLRFGFRYKTLNASTQFARIPYHELEKEIVLSSDNFLAWHDYHLERNGPEFLNRTRIGGSTPPPFDVIDSPAGEEQSDDIAPTFPPQSLDEAARNTVSRRGGLYVRGMHRGRCVGAASGRITGNVFELHFLVADAESYPNVTAGIRLRIWRELLRKFKKVGVQSIVVRSNDLSTQLLLARYAGIPPHTSVPKALTEPFAGDTKGFEYDISKVEVPAPAEMLKEP